MLANISKAFYSKKSWWTKWNNSDHFDWPCR